MLSRLAEVKLRHLIEHDSIKTGIAEISFKSLEYLESYVIQVNEQPLMYFIGPSVSWLFNYKDYEDKD